MAKQITLKQDKLFEVADKIALAYANSFSADTLSRASAFVEGKPNPSRNYVWGVLMSTRGRTGKLSEIYSKETANALCKLVIYKLAHPQAESKTVDAF